MAFIVRQYLIDTLKKENIQVSFEPHESFTTVYCRCEEFEITYNVHENYFYIYKVEFVDEENKDWEDLFRAESKIKPALEEFMKLNKYLQVERN